MTKEPICKCFAHVVVGIAVHAFSAVPRASAAAISFVLAASLSLAASNSAPVTFVSALGDDKETGKTPCTRTDPCRTFARAVSLTQAGGEVVALDSGAYDAFTIDKAVSIIAAPGEHAVISTSGTAITVAAGASDVVVVRGLTLESQFGFAGIVYTSGRKLNVESCVIDGFEVAGIQTNGPALSVKDTVIRANGSGIIGTTPALLVESVRLETNGFGLFAQSGAKVSIHRSVAANNFQGGIAADGSAEINVEGCVITNNFVGVGFHGPGLIRISGSMVTDNDVGLNQTVGGVLLSRGNNTVEGNISNVNGVIGTYAAK